MGIRSDYTARQGLNIRKVASDLLRITFASLMGIGLMTAGEGGASAGASSRTSPTLLTTLEAPIPHFADTAPVEAVVLADPLDITVSTGMPMLAGPVRVSGGSLAVGVPVSGETRKLARANGGIVNLMLILTDGSQMTSLFVPAHSSGMTTAVRFVFVTRSSSEEAVTRIVALPSPHRMPVAAKRTFSRVILGKSPGIGPCVTTHTRKSNNRVTRIGELHVAAVRTMHGTYSYRIKADSSMSVGLQAMSEKWTADGTVGIDNSTGSDSTDPHRGATKVFIDDHMNYEKVFNSCGNFNTAVQFKWRCLYLPSWFSASQSVGQLCPCAILWNSSSSWRHLVRG